MISIATDRQDLILFSDTLFCLLCCPFVMRKPRATWRGWRNEPMIHIEQKTAAGHRHTLLITLAANCELDYPIYSSTCCKTDDIVTCKEVARPSSVCWNMTYEILIAIISFSFKMCKDLNTTFDNFIFFLTWSASDEAGAVYFLDRGASSMWF
jgi:hypothetical protein